MQNSCTDRRLLCSGNWGFTEIFDWNLTWVGEKIRQQSTLCLSWISKTLEPGCFAVDEMQINTKWEHIQDQSLPFNTFHKRFGNVVTLISDYFVPLNKPVKSWDGCREKSVYCEKSKVTWVAADEQFVKVNGIAFLEPAWTLSNWKWG